MMDKYRKNFILSDSAIYYCLLCDELLGGITSNVEKHIRWDNHRKSLKNQAYFPKFRKELIYKVENHFYCELCNFVFPDIDAVTKHINSNGHKTMKTNPNTEAKIIYQYDSGYIILNKIKLDMAQWNSIVDEKCLVCNMEVKNNNLHMGLKEHILNMITSEIKCENECYYRKIDDNKYYCFSCKKVFSAQKLNSHWPSCNNIDESVIKKQKEVEFSKSIGNPTEASQTEANPNTTDKLPNKIDKLLGPLKEFFLVDQITNSATCKYCKNVVDINFMAMVGHMNYHYNNGGLKSDPNESVDSDPDTNSSLEEKKKRREEKIRKYYEIRDHGKQRSELAKYGKENSIKLNYNGSKGWCLTCDRYLSAHKNNFEQHVNGVTHQGNLELQGLISPKKHDIGPVKSKSILQCRLEYLFEDKEFYVLDYLSIDVFSFFLICRIEDPHFKKTKCYACNELLPQGQEREHCSTPKHKNKFLAAKFVMSLDVEGQFIREIRRNYFHCGFCNKTMPFLEQLLVHIVSTQHRIMQISKTGLCLGSVKFNTKSAELYSKLLHYGFGNN